MSALIARARLMTRGAQRRAADRTWLALRRLAPWVASGAAITVAHEALARYLVDAGGGSALFTLSPSPALLAAGAALLLIRLLGVLTLIAGPAIAVHALLRPPRPGEDGAAADDARA